MAKDTVEVVTTLYRVLDIRKNLFAQVTTREEATDIANSIDGGMVVEVPVN